MIDSLTDSLEQYVNLARHDGTNVDLDREARHLENTMRFRMASNLMHSTISQVKDAISGR